MFIGHYGVSFASKNSSPSIPLWVLFLAVQLLDVLWAPFVLLGVEGVRIVPGVTATNPLDLYYMPWSHSLPAAIGWSALAMLAWRLVRRRRGSAAAKVLGVAVFSHWVLDFVVHRRDLPLWGDSAKVGLGLWNYPALATALETVVLCAGIWLYFGLVDARRRATIVFGAVMLVIQLYTFFGPPPASDRAAAWTALAAYAAFAGVAARLDRAPSASTLATR
jgi:hypothetical protein